MHRFAALASLLALAGAVGCHSAFINAVVTNGTGTPISLVEVDYPSASFGTQTLAPGAAFHYRFKVLGTGRTKLLWTDEGQTTHKSDGPELKEGDEGSLALSITPSGAVWSVRPAKK